MVTAGTSAGPTEGIIATAVAGILVVVYYVLAAPGLSGELLLRRFGKVRGQVRHILFSRVLGAVLFGGVPMVLWAVHYREIIPDLALGTERFGRSLLLWLPASIVVMSVAFFVAGRASNLAHYPQVRAPYWSTGLVILSAFSWIAYLAGYEIMFRGFLLFACHAAFGFWPAVAVNILVYSLAHIPKGMTETLGAVPVGLVFCLVSLWTGSLWFALLVHITMALSNEWLSLYHHKDMKALPLKQPKGI